MTNRDNILDDSRRWLQALPSSLNSQFLMPCAPKKFGEIAKCKVQEGRIHSVAWEVAQWMEKNSNMLPSWVAVERSPEEGRRRRACGDEIEKMKKVLGDSYEYERNGLVLKGCAEIMKYKVDGGWQKNEGWDIAGLYRDEVMERVKRA